MAPTTDAESVRESKRLLRLPEAQFKYLNSGELSGSYTDRPDKLENIINDKLKLLPTRFDILIDDIDLLSQYGCFEGPIWEDAWLELLDVDQDSEIPPQFAFDPKFHDASQAAIFGEKIGRMINQLMLTPRGKSRLDIWTDLLDGFLEGLCFSVYHQRRTDTVDFRTRITEDILSTVESRHNSRAQTFEAYYESELEEQAARQEAWESILRDILDILEKHDILTEEWSASERGPPIDSPEYWLATTIYWKIFPDTGGTPGKIEEPVTESAVLEVVDQQNLEKEFSLRQLLKADAERLGEKSGRGPDPEAIFKEIFENQSGPSKNLGNRLEDNRIAGITETARDLSGQRDSANLDRDIWSDRPILKGDKDSWQLTSYGKALGYYMYDKLEPDSRGFIPEDLFEELLHN